eukprot:6663108-Alexandrium_andersonii.AAC.1
MTYCGLAHPSSGVQRNGRPAARGRAGADRRRSKPRGPGPRRRRRRGSAGAGGCRRGGPGGACRPPRTLR